MTIAVTTLGPTGRRLAGATATVALLSLAMFLFHAFQSRDTIRSMGVVMRFLDLLALLAAIAVAATTLAATLRPEGAGLLSRPALRGAAATWSALVLLAWNLTMQVLQTPDGLALWSILGLTFFVPILHLAWWAWCAPHGGLRMVHALWWMLVPIALLVVFNLEVFADFKLLPALVSIPTLLLGLGLLVVVVDGALSKRK